MREIIQNKRRVQEQDIMMITQHTKWKTCKSIHPKNTDYSGDAKRAS